MLATDRYITFWEAVNRPRTIDYPFTMIELHIGPDGKGEGKMSIATRIMHDTKKERNRPRKLSVPAGLAHGSA